MFGVQKYLFAAGYIEDARVSLDLAKKGADFYSTIGVHPCRANEIYTSVLGRKNFKFANVGQKERQELLDKYFDEIDRFILEAPKGKVVAIGECGLDYDRLEFADKESQHLAFEPHFKLTEKHNLPMYLHSRATGDEFASIIRANRHRFPTGVVHSFTGDLSEMEQLVEMGLFIGVNGCSMKTEQNCEVVKSVPLDRLMIETDCPYCDIRNSHASAQHVKTKFPRKAKDKYDPSNEEAPFAVVRDRNEPCTIVQVVEVVAALKGITT